MREREREPVPVPCTDGQPYSEPETTDWSPPHSTSTAGWYTALVTYGVSGVGVGLGVGLGLGLGLGVGLGLGLGLGLFNGIMN